MIFGVLFYVMGDLLNIIFQVKLGFILTLHSELKNKNMNWFTKIFFKKTAPKVKEKYDEAYFERLNETFDTLKFWTPELMEWIGSESNSVRLACTAHLINCHEWPDYLPSKPNDYGIINSDDAEYRLRLTFCVDLYRMLLDKANLISPGLGQKIWLTNYYKNQQP